MKSLSVLALGALTAALAFTGVTPALLKNQLPGVSNPIGASAGQAENWLGERVEGLGDWAVAQSSRLSQGIDDWTGQLAAARAKDPTRQAIAQKLTEAWDGVATVAHDLGAEPAAAALGAGSQLADAVGQSVGVSAALAAPTTPAALAAPSAAVRSDVEPDQAVDQTPSQGPDGSWLGALVTGSLDVAQQAGGAVAGWLGGTVNNAAAQLAALFGGTGAALALAAAEDIHDTGDGLGCTDRGADRAASPLQTIGAAAVRTAYALLDGAGLAISELTSLTGDALRGVTDIVVALGDQVYEAAAGGYQDVQRLVRDWGGPDAGPSLVPVSPKFSALFGSGSGVRPAAAMPFGAGVGALHW